MVFYFYLISLSFISHVLCFFAFYFDNFPAKRKTNTYQYVNVALQRRPNSESMEKLQNNGKAVSTYENYHKFIANAQNLPLAGFAGLGNNGNSFYHVRTTLCRLRLSSIGSHKCE